jgi:alpha-glucosidase
MDSPPWWQQAVVYQIYPRSFADSDGDGIGDLRGIIDRVPYLSDTLGVDAVWLSPFYPSPQADFGYDVADYCDVDPTYGTLADFDELVAALHGTGIRVIVDLVPNHTSDQHPWFRSSRSSRDDPKRGWYVWRDAAPDGGPPNNWLSNFGGSAWAWDEATGQYYLHSFLAAQPDLDWRNPDVRAAMHDVLRFWLDRGVDGFRIDVAHRIAKDPDLRDEPVATRSGGPGKELGEYDSLVHVHSMGHPDVHEYFRGIRAVLDEYDDRYAIGEIHEFDWERWASYHGDGDELHQVFDFSLLYAPWEADAIADLLDAQECALAAGGWPNHVLGNHDEPRIAFRRGPEQARVGAFLLLTSRGTPTLYYGDELGMTQPDIPPDRQLDPWGRVGEVIGRDGCRTPMQWAPGPHAGFSPAWCDATWLPVQGNADRVCVEAQLAEPDSMLALHRRLLAVRRAEAALRVGAYRRLQGAGDGLLVWERSHGDDRFATVLSFVDHPVEAELPGRWEVAVASHVDLEGRRVADSFTVGPHTALLLREV